MIILSAPGAYAAARQNYISRASIFDGIATEDIITPNDATIIYLGSGELSASIGAVKMPCNSTDGKISYTSDDSHITVDQNGIVTSDGTYASATITMTAGSVSKAYPVYAMQKIERFSLSESRLDMYADKPVAAALSVICEPEPLPDGALIWYSGDEGIATVTENGLVIPNGVGTTSVYAKTPDGEKTAKCTVYVALYDVKAKAVFITNAIDKMKLGSSYELSAYIYPDTVSDKALRWTSSDSTVVAVDENGTAYAREMGTATITARSANDKTDAFELAVVPASDPDFKYTVISRSVTERIAEFYTKPVFVDYGYTIADMTAYQMQCAPVNYEQNRAATDAEVRAALTPSNNASGYGKYQFIDLSSPNGTDADTINRYLQGKGVLEGKGQQFLDAAKQFNLSELYLVTHACLESGDGYSRLARGVEVNGTTVYNVFGIGAFDENAVSYGSSYAYRMGWTSVDAAIYGGARWISENYINDPEHHQNTLYKMRWDPDMPGKHQYATDIAWATAQAKTLKSMFDAFPDAELHYEIPLYKGESEFKIK